MHIRMVHFCVYIVVYVCGGRVVHINQGCTSFFWCFPSSNHKKGGALFIKETLYKKNEKSFYDRISCTEQ